MNGMKQFHELCMTIKVENESYPHFNASFLQNAREEKEEQCIAK